MTKAALFARRVGELFVPRISALGPPLWARFTCVMLLLVLVAMIFAGLMTLAVFTMKTSKGCSAGKEDARASDPQESQSQSQSTGSFGSYTASDEEQVSSSSWHTKESCPESIGAHFQRNLRFETLLDVLPTTFDPAMIEPDSQQRPLNHETVRRFIAETFDLRPWVPNSSSRVAVALPNGRDCALVTLACIATHSCVPMSPDSSQKDLVDSFAWLGCVALVCLEGSSADAAAKATGIARIHVAHGFGGQPTLRSPGGASPMAACTSGPPHRSLRHMSVLTIMTSGTTGQKKAAVHTLDSVVVGGFCIAKSWNLTREDVGLNMMPMFHIGGIARNLFAAMLSGGSVCFVPGFDAERFWALVGAHKVTWYYGSPTIHEEILRASGTMRNGTLSSLRFVANAAGHLQHSLAQRMASEFQCAILPCYGCSEAMPISSPPPDYQLNKPGSSGIPCGPELLIADNEGGVLEAGETGHILVRGSPCMQGYEGHVQPSTVMPGWFDTGDMGHLDKDGWLFITGRSKEVINRGGEIIAPMEVEEALSDFPGLREVAAFAAPHDLMQEVVGIAVVCAKRRPSLRSLQRYLSSRLHLSSMPQIVVFMDSLPRGKTGKVIRLKLAERCGLPVLRESMSLLDRHWEAVERSPPCVLNSPNTNIPCEPVQVDLQKLIAQSMASGICVSGKASCVKARGQVSLAVHAAFREAFTRKQAQALLEELEANEDLHDYEIPSLVVPLEEHWEHDPSKQCWRGEDFVAPSGEWEERITRIWQEHLASASDGEFWLSACADFFEAGGTSLLAGRTIAQLRSQYGVSLRVQDAFEHRTVQAMACLCEQRAAAVASPDRHAKLAHFSKESAKAKHLPRLSGALLQHIPVMLLIPTKLMIRLLCYIGMYASSHRLFAPLMHHGSETRVVLVAFRIGFAIGLTRLLVQLIFPFITIMSKWLIIGRYKAGEYPMWSNMYYRWWLVEKIIGIFGPGFFEWSRSLMTVYYRVMGAKVGQRVAISQKAKLAEFDLLQIGDDAIVGSVSIVRGFAVTRGGFTLQPVYLGRGSEVCLQSIVAPGHTVPDGAHVPPLSSSHSLSAAPAPRGRYDPSFCQEPCLALKLLLGYPLVMLQSVLMYAPSAFMIFYMVTTVGHNTPRTNARDVLAYFAEPQRLAILLAMSYVRSTLEPVIGLAFAIGVKRIVLGRFKAGRQEGQWPAFQRYMLPWLLGRSSDSGDGAEDLVAMVTDFFGTHFQVTGWILRALGSKVGDRVYWPGSGLQIVEYDLLEIGNDVVFGSRSLIAFRSGDEVKPIRIGSGAMVADRCVLLPGSSLGTNCMLGSGGLCPEDRALPANSTWVGSEGGNPVEMHMPVNSVSTIKPFGRAFYGGEAPYFVLPVAAHTLNSLIWAPLVHHETKVRVILMLLFMHRYSAQWLQTADLHYTIINLFLIAVFVQGLLSMMLLAACIGLQHLIIGTRTPGNVSWDKSSYCQRWLLHRRVRRSVQSTLDLLGGTPMLNGFFRASGAQIGAGTCLYPTGATPMMTEPELVTIGEGACIDDCSLVAHSNTHGEMELRKVLVGSMAMARSRTRVLSGGAMDDNTELREHTLVLPGDCVPSGEVWQGWPARSRWPLPPPTPAV